MGAHATRFATAVACGAASAALLAGCAGAAGPTIDAPVTPSATEAPSAEATATPLDPAGRIAFGRWSATEDRGAPPVMWTVATDGSDPRPVGEQRGWYMEWSPDHATLIFDLLDADGNEQIATIAPDGTGYTALTSGTGFHGDPAYSPDGSTIVFDYSDVPESDPAWTQALWVMDADGSHPRVLLDDEASDFDWEPEYSPDGTRIVFMREHPDGARSAVFTIAADGTGLERLTPFGDYLEHPRWSPDGATVIYNVENKAGGGIADPVNGIWTVPADGGEPAQLLSSADGLHGFKPVYSADGAQILFGCSDTDALNEDVCVMNADGTGIRRILETPEFENHAVW
ncbi:TolB family protein [Demequina maris]|uniref:TolB family protein n=1 Tax=Demequina maris TaxID=1638982 RepID=UPI000780E075|nr:PD40 domain-containing protein [Demequina maris]